MWKKLSEFSPIRRLIERGKIGWYRVLRFFRVARPTLAWSGSTPREETEAVPIEGRPADSQTPFDPSPHPILTILQRRAVWELFDELGIELVPIAFWKVLEEILDPANALTEFIRQNRLDPEAVRRRRSPDIDTFRTLVNFICQVETTPDSASERQRIWLEAMIHWGDFDRAKQLREIFVTLNEALEEYKASPGPLRFKVFELLAEEINKLRLRADDVSLHEARHVVGLSRRYSEAMVRFKSAESRLGTVRTFIRDNWASWDTTKEEATIRDGILRRASDAQRAMLSDPACDIGAMLNVFEQCVEDLSAMAEELAAEARTSADDEARERARRAEEEEEARRSRRTGGRSRHAETDPERMSLDDLLAFFDFPAGSRPSSKELGAAMRRIHEECDPGNATAPNFEARTDHWRRTILCFKRLKVELR